MESVGQLFTFLLVATLLVGRQLPQPPNHPTLQFFLTWTHTTQADWMAGERDHLDVRTLDALGTPYGFDRDPRGAMRLRSPPGTWSKHPASPVRDTGEEGAWDDAVVNEAKVVYDGETYHMWFAGRKRGPPGLKMPIDLGYATSTDGVHWGKYDANPMLKRGPLGGYDENMISAPFVLYDGEQFHMWFSAVDFRGDWSINHAASPDGVLWAKHQENPLLKETHDARWDAVYIAEPCVLFNGSSFQMWYNGASATTETLLGYTTSPDGIHWTRIDEDHPVLDVGPDGAWDDFAVARAHVLFDGEQYKMWYEGHSGRTWRIGYATSIDGVHWERFSGNPIVDRGPEGAWDSAVVSEPYVVFDGQTYRFFHSGYDGDLYRVGLTTAPAVYGQVGTYISSPIESPRTIEWGTLTCDLSLPEGTEVRFEVAASDDGETWGAWTLAVSELVNGVNHADLTALDLPRSRFLRYRATLSTSDPAVSPLIREITVAEAMPDFAMSLSQDTISLEAGGQAEVVVSFESLRGFSAPVELNVDGLPSAVAAAWKPRSVTPPGSVAITLAAGQRAQLGTVPLTIAATSGDLHHLLSLSLNLVKPPPTATPTPTLTSTPTALPTPTATPTSTPTPLPPPPPLPPANPRALWQGIGLLHDEER